LKGDPERKEIFGHRIMAHQLAQRRSTHTHSNKKYVYELLNTGALVNYLHKAIFSPTKAALIKAIKQGNITTWPGLIEDAINNHLKLTPATAMEHMN
jgi:hypothetical protein